MISLSHITRIVDRVWQDLRQGWRMFVKTPGFTARQPARIKVATLISANYFRPSLSAPNN